MVAKYSNDSHKSSSAAFTSNSLFWTWNTFLSFCVLLWFSASYFPLEADKRFSQLPPGCEPGSEGSVLFLLAEEAWGESRVIIDRTKLGPKFLGYLWLS